MKEEMFRGMRMVDNRSRWRRFTDFMMRLWYHFPLRRKTYTFPKMSRLVTSLVDHSPYYREGNITPGQTRLVIKCKSLMDAEEAQLVLDESKITPAKPRG